MLRFLLLLVLAVAGITPFTVFAEELEKPQPWQWMLGVHSNYQYTLANPDKASTPLLYRVRLIDKADTEGVVLLSSHADFFKPDVVLRQRLYQFIERRNGWVQHIFEVPHDLTNTQLSDPVNWQPLHGCSIQWTQKSEHFVASNNSKRCYFLLQGTGQRIAVTSEVRLFPDHFVLKDHLAVTDLESHVVTEENIQTEYQRTMFYDVQASYSAHDNQWQDVVTTVGLHDQGVRSGLELQASGLELRYQIELQREGAEVKFMLHDISLDAVIHEETFAHNIDVIEYSSERLQLKIKPRP